MMRIKTLFLAFIFLAGFFSMQVLQAKSPTQTQGSSQSVVLDVQKMTCAVCPITIRKVLQGVDGVQSAKVDLGSKTASVSFDPQKTDIGSLIKATTNAGFPATSRQEK